MKFGDILAAACGNYILMMGAALLSIIFLFGPLLRALGAFLVFLNGVG